MSSEVAIHAEGLSKCYQLYDRPQDRLKQFVSRGKRKYFREFWALTNVSLTLNKGEVLGIVGRNGAGKSTLLQLICGTLSPTAGQLEVHGRIAALLELGAGFNPDFTGRENVFLSGSVMGVAQGEIERRFDEIVDFAELRDFIDQPVKTYSSGMYVRLAFAVATAVDPDILIIDEALSVGDGAFARKSFERIMALKDRGATILFCSHSMYMVEALCDRAVWIEKGSLRRIGPAAEVTRAYSASLDAVKAVSAPEAAGQPAQSTSPQPSLAAAAITRIAVCRNGVEIRSDEPLVLTAQRDDLEVGIAFRIDPQLPPPTVGVGIATASMIGVASASTLEDRVTVAVDSQGNGNYRVVFPALPLLQGSYTLSVFLVCERGLHPYEAAEHVRTFEVRQDGLAQGLVALPHSWHQVQAQVAESTSQAQPQPQPARAQELPALGFVTACNDIDEIGSRLLTSPCLGENRYPHSIVTACDSAAAAMNPLLDQAPTSRWLVWVHQDVVLPQGWDTQFIRALEEAELKFGRIDVAGVYGIGHNAQGPFRAGRLLDRGERLEEAAPLPCLADSLDELLFAVRSDSPLRLDPALRFDFYATDLVLSARARGLTSVVVDAWCEHHSKTPRDGVSAKVLDRIGASGEQFLAKWGHALPIYTPCFDLEQPGDFAAILNGYRSRAQARAPSASSA